MTSTWEYRTVSTAMRLEHGDPTDRRGLGAAADTAAAAWLDDLNAFGADGWEVVGPIELTGQAATGSTEERSILLRRQVRDSAAVTGD